MLLSLIPKILDPKNMIMLVFKPFRMVNTIVLKLRYIKSIVALLAITINNAVRLYFTSYNGQ